jgi:hypothetical protein
MTAYNAAEKIEELRREWMTRERVYPTWVRLGRISEKTAAYRIAILQAICEDYEEQAKKERLL